MSTTLDETTTYVTLQDLGEALESRLELPLDDGRAWYAVVLLTDDPDLYQLHGEHVPASHTQAFRPGAARARVQGAAAGRAE
jgi:hypothetical protein